MVADGNVVYCKKGEANDGRQIHDWDEYGPHGVATGLVCKLGGMWTSA